MRFRLTYDGTLRASGNSSGRLQDKWSIRNAVHPQLDELWATDPKMTHAREAANVPRKGGYFHVENANIDEPTPVRKYDPEEFKNLFEPIVVGGHQFMPLIRKSVGLACSLDIIFMRKGEIGSLVSQDGDLDNRIKTLFDGLRMPLPSEMGSHPPAEEPFHCLLEDDALITGFQVDTDRLLTKPDSDIHEVRLVIDVSVRVMRAGIFNMPFLAK
jgi:hypothetical protein